MGHSADLRKTGASTATSGTPKKFSAKSHMPGSGSQGMQMVGALVYTDVQ